MLADWEVPSSSLRGEGISPTEFILKKTVSEQATLNVNFCYVAILSNALVERGASAVKRMKPRLRKRLGNDTLSSLIHITLNGPPGRSAECQEILKDATKQWRKTHVKNLPPPVQQLP